MRNYFELRQKKKIGKFWLRGENKNKSLKKSKEKESIIYLNNEQ